MSGISKKKVRKDINDDLHLAFLTRGIMSRVIPDSEGYSLEKDVGTAQILKLVNFERRLQRVKGKMELYNLLYPNDIYFRDDLGQVTEDIESIGKYQDDHIIGVREPVDFSVRPECLYVDEIVSTDRNYLGVRDHVNSGSFEVFRDE